MLKQVVGSLNRRVYCIMHYLNELYNFMLVHLCFRFEMGLN
jgi:hypothetical protein